MQILPAIDIKEGKCVRLYQGAFDKVTEYSHSPLAVANAYIAEGATQLHIVDLDGAKRGCCAQMEIMAQLGQLPITIQVGGGIRTTSQIESLLSTGVSRVVIGSMAITQPQTVKAWLQKFGAEKIILAMDLRLNTLGEPWLVTQGWQQAAQCNLWELLEFYTKYGLQTILCTDISRDGTLLGPNFSLYAACQQRFPELCVQASGGISSIADLQYLKRLNLSGAIVGKALYEKRFSLTEALLC